MASGWRRLIGQNLASDAVVLFGATVAPGVSQISSTELQVVVPAGTGPGPVDVIVSWKEVPGVTIESVRSRLMRRPETDVVFADLETGGDDASAPHGLWATLAWFGFLLGLSALLGFILALAIFLVSFLRMRAGITWLHTIILTVAGIGVLMFLGGSLGRDFPPGLLQEFVDLPWPLT